MLSQPISNLNRYPDIHGINFRKKANRSDVARSEWHLSWLRMSLRSLYASYIDIGAPDSNDSRGRRDDDDDDDDVARPACKHMICIDLCPDCLQ